MMIFDDSYHDLISTSAELLEKKENNSLSTHQHKSKIISETNKVIHSKKC